MLFKQVIIKSFVIINEDKNYSETHNHRFTYHDQFITADEYRCDGDVDSRDLTDKNLEDRTFLERGLLVKLET